MTDSIHSAQAPATPPPASLPPLPHEESGLPHIEVPSVNAADEAAVRELIQAHSAPAPAKSTESRPARAAQATASVDTLAADTLDIVPAAKSQARLGVSIDAPAAATHANAGRSGETVADTASWVIMGMLVLFLLVAFRMRRNFKYLKGLIRESVDSRERQNMFVDTARESTFALLLNLLCVACFGLLLAQGVEYWRGGVAPPAGEFPPGLWACLAIAAAFYLFHWIAYLIIGYTFTTRVGAHLWVQGFKAVSGLMSLGLFPLALVGTFYPQGLQWVLTAAVSLYVLSRFLFIFKGIRIFSAHRTYYILFLYYLCSVEIVPVLLLWQAACRWG